LGPGKIRDGSTTACQLSPQSCGGSTTPVPTPTPPGPNTGPPVPNPAPPGPTVTPAPRPIVIITPGSRGDRDRGDRGFEQPRYVAQPGYAPQPRYASDDPVCVQGTWIVQNYEKRYVCLTWQFRGQVYNSEQLKRVLAQLGRPWPALLMRS
jgi:hypothetical protein